ncbi:histidinol dehydrogenase [Flavobacterium macrobrachii]|uniref:Histidinol dehydrogenase n=1 Tax=Flavobacterium macrobrachii TaxID=591204 RepID=A0ABS2CYI8_9FLAO|nr:histidinol dehydrogenase [Flavobacterium macrobrachii]MBM6500010.1 histidinol dehydrogenase [Flavobacterium macrobrachii]PZO29283.1 MAG: histidinol dehydrogenase [Flavobacteriaceae bacterium]
MKTYINPNAEQWNELAKRKTVATADLNETVKAVFNDIQKNGSKAVKKYTSYFDGVSIENFAVTPSEIENAVAQIPTELKNAIQIAADNISKFHSSQKEIPTKIETTSGVFCWRESRAIDTIGIYIPGGTAPLFSTVLMLAIPAKLAGCKNIILCSPPDKNGNINPAILYAAQLTGVTQMYKVGGIQAIAAMTFGTDEIPKVSKIFGPGNQYVTAAKQYAQQLGLAIDMPAGPSELLVIADASCDPEFVASDLLSQAEHGGDSQVILVTNSEEIVSKVSVAIENQKAILPRQATVEKALENSRALVFEDIKTAIEFSNFYAPEHLILAIENAEDKINLIENAGSIFLGNYSCESAGDYASGTNHTLPTNGYAKNYSGVSLDSFVKKITIQKLTSQGIQNLGPTIEIMAAAEQLDAHKNAVSIRLKKIQNG